MKRLGLDFAELAAQFNLCTANISSSACGVTALRYTFQQMSRQAKARWANMCQALLTAPFEESLSFAAFLLLGRLAVRP